jgi:hypothetical protein
LTSSWIHIMGVVMACACSHLRIASNISCGHNAGIDSLRYQTQDIPRILPGDFFISL